MKKVLLFGLLLMAGMLHAQDNYFYLSWNYNIPLSNTTWLDEGSASGGSAGYRAFIGGGRFSAGLDFNWATYDQYEPTETFQQENGAITTDYFKYIYNYGIVASGQYNFPLGEKELFIPYAGLGLGANYNDYTIYYNIYEDNDNAWGFLVRPEAGILVRFSERKSIGAIAGVHYDFSTNKSADFDYDAFSALGFKIGLLLMHW